LLLCGSSTLAKQSGQIEQHAFRLWHSSYGFHSYDGLLCQRTSSS